MTQSYGHNTLALLIDIENVIVGLYKMGLPIDIGAVIKKLLDEFSNPKMQFRRAYGDIYAAVRQLQKHAGPETIKGLHWHIRDNLVGNLVQIFDTPYFKSKNSADMWLTVDALSIAQESPGIDRFVIVSSDRDYIPLILKLQELGKEVIGIGISRDVNPLYVKACDFFYYYSGLFASREDREQEVIDVVPRDTASTRRSYVKLLIQATKTLNQEGKQANGTRIVTLMKQFCPDYDPKLAGLNSSKHLARVAEEEGFVKCESAGMDFVLTLIQSTPVNPNQVPSGLGPSEPAIDPLNFESCVSTYRKFFQGKLAIEEIPNAHARRVIFSSSNAILGEVGSIFLSDLSHQVAEIIGAALAPEKSVFKLLYGLYRGGAFSYDASVTKSRFNPQITGRLLENTMWDGCFVKNSLKVLANEKPDWPVVEGALAEVFGVSTEQIKELIGRAVITTRSYELLVQRAASMTFGIKQSNSPDSVRSVSQVQTDPIAHPGESHFLGLPEVANPTAS